jgi:hypothetical protein
VNVPWTKAKRVSGATSVIAITDVGDTFMLILSPILCGLLAESGEQENSRPNGAQAVAKIDGLTIRPLGSKD